jgi:hypothetical protein
MKTVIVFQLIIIFMGAIRPDEVKQYDYYIGLIIGAFLYASWSVLFKGYRKLN